MVVELVELLDGLVVVKLKTKENSAEQPGYSSTSKGEREGGGGGVIHRLIHRPGLQHGGKNTIHAIRANYGPREGKRRGTLCDVVTRWGGRGFRDAHCDALSGRRIRQRL